MDYNEYSDKPNKYTVYKNKRNNNSSKSLVYEFIFFVIVIMLIISGLLIYYPEKTSPSTTMLTGISKKDNKKTKTEYFKHPTTKPEKKAKSSNYTPQLAKSIDVAKEKTPPKKSNSISLFEYFMFFYRFN